MFGLRNVLGKRKGKAPAKASLTKKLAKKTFWVKEAICLRYMDQTKAYDTEEKMKLAQMGLGFKELKFDNEGDAFDIHSTLLSAYPHLKDCGGYCLMRLRSGSSELVTIESPKSGFTMKYLKDILKTAKLFIRPLQKDIEEASVKEEEENEVYYVVLIVRVAFSGGRGAFPLVNLQIEVS